MNYLKCLPYTIFLKDYFIIEFPNCSEWFIFFFYTYRKCESELECWQKCIIMFYNEYNFCRHMCLITQNRRWEHTNILKTCSILHTILISSLFYDFALSNTSETWNIERILVFLYGTYIPPPPTNFKNKNFAPFSWSGSLTMGGELRLLEGLNPLSPPSNLYRLQCLWSLCSLTFSWEHADCWTSHLEWCWSYCWRNSYKKKKKIPFLRNASLKYSCNP